MTISSKIIMFIYNKIKLIQNIKYTYIQILFNILFRINYIN